MKCARALLFGPVHEAVGDAAGVVLQRLLGAQVAHAAGAVAQMARVTPKRSGR